MITTFILSIPLFFIQALINVLPNSNGLPSEVTSAIVTVWNYGQGASFFFPISTLLTLVVLVFAFEAGILAWKFVNWILRKIPGVN